MNKEQSMNLFEKAVSVIPGGVNSPVRACKSVGMSPVFIQKANGSRLYDADGNEYIDYVGSWGPMILGHRHPSVVKSISGVLNRGTSFGAPTDLEVEMAELIIETVPSIEMVRMVSSGTEATMSAIRLARGVTKRDKIIKFDGCYHGHADSLLVEAGSGVATLNIAGSPGIPESFVRNTLSLPYNDIECFKKVMATRGHEIACVIVEPVAGNMGLVPPVDGFLEALREQTTEYECLLIFDEVISGFRVSLGGAQELYGINPDITCLGKIIGGGMPVGAYGGSREIMEHMSPVGPVYQAGTLSGNPVAMVAGIATLTELKKDHFYEKLDKKAQRLAQGMADAARGAGLKLHTTRVGSLLGLFFTDQKVENYEDAKTCDLELFARYYRLMLSKGIYLAPSQFETSFVSSAHSMQDIEKTIAVAEEVFRQLAYTL